MIEAVETSTRSASRSPTPSRRRPPCRAVLGLRDVGRIEIGGAADIVVVDDNLRIERVLVGGERVVA